MRHGHLGYERRHRRAWVGPRRVAALLVWVATWWGASPSAQAQPTPDPTPPAAEDGPAETGPVEAETANTPDAQLAPEDEVAPQAGEARPEQSPDVAAPEPESVSTPRDPAEASARADTAQASETDEVHTEAEASDPLPEEVMDEADLDRLLGGSASPVSLNFYGFADAGLSHSFLPDDNVWHASLDGNSSFFVGNVNLYMDAELGANARSLIEVRFLFQPQNVTNPDGTRMGVAPDHADRNRDLRWGGIELERVWVEYNFHNLFSARVGSFLTPYGIWNVDHGSPTVIPVNRPYIVGNGLMPERQTGVQVFGAQAFNGLFSGGYHLTISNGRGPVDSFKDLDGNKALGWRFYVDLTALGVWRLGTSGYYGRYTDAWTNLGSNDGRTVLVTDIDRQYDELVLTADLKWTYRAFIFQSEFIHNQRAYTDRGRVSTVAGGPFPMDDIQWGAYFLAGYTLPWFDLMPFGYAEYFNMGVNPLLVGVAGLRWNPLPPLVVKGQFTRAILVDASPASGLADAYNALQFQVAWAF